MHDLEIHLPNQPGGLALIGEALAGAEISIEGGGVWTVGDTAVAHFLVHDGGPAADALAAADLPVHRCSEVVLLRLDQARPGQLGKLARAMADNGVNIAVQYSDHDGQLVLVVDDPTSARRVADEWMSASRGHDADSV